MNLPFVAAAPAVLVLLGLGFAAATLDDLARIELMADDAADDAAALAMEVASGRTGTEEKDSGAREDSWSCAVARRGMERRGMERRM